MYSNYVQYLFIRSSQTSESKPTQSTYLHLPGDLAPGCSDPGGLQGGWNQLGGDHFPRGSAVSRRLWSTKTARQKGVRTSRQTSESKA